MLHQNQGEEIMSQNIVFLKDITNDSLPVGGKGVNLGQLTQQNIPVPPGFCLTTLAYQQSMGLALRKEGFLQQLEALGEEEGQNIQDTAQTIRQFIIQQEFPPSLRDEIIQTLGQIDRQGFYAVRSSATTEDLPGLSFAGQQDTYLNCHGEEGILTSIQQCWASLYNERAVRYRKKNRIPEEKVWMAVIIQSMIAAEKSGIAFTADPLRNNWDCISINAGFGLGEALVAGLITPDLYQYSKSKRCLVKKEVALKEIGIYALPSGGTQTRPLAPAQQKKQVLSSEAILVLCRLCQKTEDLFGYPQDIEWCMDAQGALYVVQARPITSLYPKVKTVKDNKKHVFLSFNHIQVMTDPIKPLGLDFLAHIFFYGQNPKTNRSDLLHQAGGRLYLDYTALLQLPLRQKLLAVLSNMDQQMAQGLAAYLQENHLPLRWPGPQTREFLSHFLLPLLRQTWRNYRRAGQGQGRDTVEAFIRQYPAALEKRIQQAESPWEQLLEVKACTQDCLKTIFLHIFPSILPGMISYKQLKALLQREGLDPKYADQIVAGLEGNITTQMGLLTGELAELIQKSPQDIALLRQNPRTAHLALLQHSQNPVLKETLEHFLQTYGMRGIGEIDITRDRYAEDFRPLAVGMLNQIDNADLVSPRQSYQKLVQLSLATEQKLLSKLQDQDPRVKRKAEQLIHNMRAYLSLREHGKYALMLCFGIFRRVLNACSQELQQRKVLRKAQDFHYLTMDEVIEGLTGKGAKLQVLADERKQTYASYQRLTPPRVMDEKGIIYHSQANQGQQATNASRVLGGAGVSAGVVEGYARVLLDAHTQQLQKDEILVTKFTDPGWTPLFIQAQGLVLEVGGLMTHGAIVAREYGLPCVVGVAQATDKIRTGDFLRVDGNKGTVEILNRP